MDTNAILYFLYDKEIASVKAKFSISFITEIELLSYPYINKEEEEIIKSFLNVIDIVDINPEIKRFTIDFRKKYKLRVPDAIICATAYSYKILLVSNDKQLFKAKECAVMKYEDFKNLYCILKNKDYED